MNIERADLKQLRLPIAACMALIVAGTVCAYAAQDRLRNARLQTAAAATQRAAAQARLARASAQEREVTAGLPQFEALAARGIIGEEDRLDWVDRVGAIRKERRLFSIRYTIEPQRGLDYPGFDRGGSVKFMASRVKISMDLLHEGDLLNLIDDLVQRGKFHLSVRSCDVQRAGSEGDLSALAPRLQADCEFDLVTVRIARNHESVSTR